MDPNLYWVWLSEALGPANDSLLILLEHFGSAEMIYRAEKWEYEAWQDRMRFMSWNSVHMRWERMQSLALILTMKYLAQIMAC